MFKFEKWQTDMDAVELILRLPGGWAVSITLALPELDWWRKSGGEIVAAKGWSRSGHTREPDGRQAG